MSGGPAQSGHSSAAGRLVARSRRAAVRARESPAAIPALEVVEAHVPGAIGPRAFGPGAIGPGAIGPGAIGTVRPGPAQLTAGPGYPQLPKVAVAPVLSAPVASAKETAPQQGPPQALEPAALRGEASVPAPAATSKPETVELVEGPGGLPAWTLAAPSSPATTDPPPPSLGDAPPPPETPPGPGLRPGPAEQLHAHVRAAEPERAVAPPARPTESQRGELLPTPLPTARAPAPIGPARRSEPVPPTPPATGPPQVLIDRIEVITPPARPAQPDPFLSLAAQRAGASRHERARWRG